MEFDEYLQFLNQLSGNICVLLITRQIMHKYTTYNCLFHNNLSTILCALCFLMYLVLSYFIIL